MLEIFEPKILYPQSLFPWKPLQEDESPGSRGTPSPRQPPSGSSSSWSFWQTYIDPSGVEGALLGNLNDLHVSKGAQGQKGLALVGEGQANGHRQPHQAEEREEGAADAEGENSPSL